MEPFAEARPERIERRGAARGCAIPETVRRLVDRLDSLEDPRAARVARARHLLLTGRLDTAAVHRETARRMLGLD